MKLRFSTRESFQLYRNLSKVSQKLAASQAKCIWAVRSQVLMKPKRSCLIGISNWFFSIQQYNDASSSDGLTKLNNIHFTTTEIELCSNVLTPTKPRDQIGLVTKFSRTLPVACPTLFYFCSTQSSTKHHSQRPGSRVK